MVFSSEAAFALPVTLLTHLAVTLKNLDCDMVGDV
jgi:hypothetical protein